MNLLGEDPGHRVVRRGEDDQHATRAQHTMKLVDNALGPLGMLECVDDQGSVERFVGNRQRAVEVDAQRLQPASGGPLEQAKVEVGGHRGVTATRCAGEDRTGAAAEIEDRRGRRQIVERGLDDPNFADIDPAEQCVENRPIVIVGKALPFVSRGMLHAGIVTEGNARLVYPLGVMAPGGNMRPTRAAWFFVAGLAWLVIRGLLVQTIPSFGPARIAEHGGLWLVIPFVSFVASLTAPLFFGSFLRTHDFAGQQLLRWATVAAFFGSVLACGLVLVSFVATLRGGIAPGARPAATLLWAAGAVPLFFVLTIFVFLIVFSATAKTSQQLRSAARIAAGGAAVPLVMMLIWAVHRATGGPAWYADFSRSMAARLIGLAAAATLVMFLESFARCYHRPER